MGMYVPPGRSLMGEYFDRARDYPQRLKNKDRSDRDPRTNEFWRCRSCESAKRLPGIYWCRECAYKRVYARQPDYPF